MCAVLCASGRPNYVAAKICKRFSTEHTLQNARAEFGSSVRFAERKENWRALRQLFLTAPGVQGDLANRLFELMHRSPGCNSFTQDWYIPCLHSSIGCKQRSMIGTPDNVDHMLILCLERCGIDLYHHGNIFELGAVSHDGWLVFKEESTRTCNT